MSTDVKNQQLLQVGVETGFKQWFASLVVFVMLFILPIQAVNWLNSPQGSVVSAGRVAGIATDNSGRYFQIPLLNVPFDTTLRDPGTLSLIFGSILVILAIIIITVAFSDFRKREHKYSQN